MHICTFCFLLWVQNEKKYFLHIIFPFLMQVIKWLTSLSIHIMNRDIVPAMLLLLNHAQFFFFPGISSNPTTWVLPFTCGIKSTGSSLHVGSSSKPFALFFQYIMLYECLFIFIFSLYQLERCLSLGQISTYLLR